ncbi:hypothetical protein K432DRAFT_440365 [Lepidopterella palustris CBS 459.81]|uniref:Fumarylacetoacetase n=1 Tax=Lepidopterella palustris CBS 459.81 TaxID=1314670 RepID=A0A8E2EHE3_9PEZI|nr:hypothetical protein K432DRAFT_440365 [Lepidopterella palustris CBS 459.81]
MADSPSPQCVTRIRNEVIFLAVLAKRDLFPGIKTQLEVVFSQPTLNAFAALPKSIHDEVREAIKEIYTEHPDEVKWLVANGTESAHNVQMHVLISISSFTRAEASQTGLPTLPNAYADSASSVVVSGTPIERPVGQFLDDCTAVGSDVICEASGVLNYEFQVAAIIGKLVGAGQIPRTANADGHIFGLVLLNNWIVNSLLLVPMLIKFLTSARDPLNPSNNKHFHTSMSPWVISTSAAFLADTSSINYAISLRIEVIRNGSSTTTCFTSFGTMARTLYQMIASRASCGKVPGTGDDEHGFLAETKLGGKAVEMADGSELLWLRDGDIVKITGTVGGEKYGVGFGECVGEIKATKIL